MRKNIHLYFVLACILSGACKSADKKADVGNPMPAIDIAETVFSFGPTLDTLNAKISAECDCCGSDIFFRRDSSFVAIYYCMEGDTYWKGKYKVEGNNLILVYNPLHVTQQVDEITDSLNTDQSKFQIERINLPDLRMKISFLKSNILFTSKKNDVVDYGMKDLESSTGQFIKQIKKDSIWQKLELY